MTAAESALLAAIAAEPPDDGTRLVYADFLEERGGPGDAARAEFVRLQLRLAAGPNEDTGWCHHSLTSPPDCRGCALERRAGALLAAHGEAWTRAVMPAGCHYLAPYDCYPNDGVVDSPDHGWTEVRGRHPGAAAVRFRRGFAGWLRSWASHWVWHADGLLGRAPLAEVSLTTWPELNLAEDRAGGFYEFSLRGRGRPCQIAREYLLFAPLERCDLDAAGRPRAFIRRILHAEWPRLAFGLPDGSRVEPEKGEVARAD